MIKPELKSLTKRMKIFAPNLEELTEAVYRKAEEENRIGYLDRKVVIRCKVERNSPNWVKLLRYFVDFNIGPKKSLLRSRLSDMNEAFPSPGPSNTSITRKIFNKAKDSTSSALQ